VAHPLPRAMNDQLAGYLAVLVSCLGFGSNYLPAKKVDVHDGQLFNVFLACGILTVGLVQWAIMGFYKFEPFAMWGGVLWGVGNLAVPFILARCGLGLGQLLWGLSQILIGWATGKFGLFGKEKDNVANGALNYLGVAMLMVSLCLFSLMRPPSEAETDAREVVSSQRTVNAETAKGDSNMVAPLRDPESIGQSSAGARACEVQQPRNGGSSSSPPAGGFCAGLIAALMAGVLFGANFDPPTYLKQLGQQDMRDGLPPRHSVNDVDYVISHFCGIFLVTVGAFVLQKLVRPEIFLGKQVILPGLAAGIMWGIAQVAWFKANGVLSYVVSFPIIVGVPGVIAALWGCFLFGENRGLRNGVLLCCVILLQGVAVVCIALSKGS